MADDKRLDIIISLKDGATKGLKSITGAFNKLALSPIKKATNLVTGLGKSLFSLPGLIAGGAIGALGKEVVDITAKFEQWKIAFTTLTGSAENANKLLKDIKEFAAATPFELPGLVDSSKQLLAFGFRQEEIIDTMRRLGDIAAGVGTDKLPTLVSSLGKIRTKGRASLEELNMMLEAGVPILDSLANGLDVSKEKLFEMITDGEIGFDQVNAAVTDLTNNSSMFGGLMAAQSQSLGGIFSNISDNMTQAALAIGNMVLPQLKAVAEWVRDFTSTDKLDAFVTGIKNFGITVQSEMKIRFEMIKEIITNPLSWSTWKPIVKDTVTNAIKGFKLLWKVIKTLGREGLDEIKDLYKEEQKDTRTLTQEIESIRKQAANKIAANNKALNDKLKANNKKTASDQKSNMSDVVDWSKLKDEELEAQGTATAAKVLQTHKWQLAELKQAREVSLQEEIEMLEESIKANEFKAGEQMKIETKIFELKSKQRKQEEKDQKKLNKEQEKLQEKRVQFFQDASDAIIANEGDAVKAIGGMIKKMLIDELSAFVAKEQAKLSVVAAANWWNPIGWGAAAQIVALEGLKQGGISAINSIKFQNGGVVPDTNGTIGDRNTLPMASFNGNENIMNPKQAANVLHHISNNRSDQTPSFIRKRGSNATDSNATIELHVDGMKLGQAVVTGYNRGRRLNTVTRLKD